MPRDTHPEALTGEFWLGNMWACDFRAVGWKSKRLGRVAYDVHGRRLKGFRPVFVATAEFVAAGVDIPTSGPADHRW